MRQCFRNDNNIIHKINEKNNTPNRAEHSNARRVHLVESSESMVGGPDLDVEPIL